MEQSIPELKFFRLSWQMDESHSEVGYYYIGEPDKNFDELIAESKEEFEVLTMVGKNIHLDGVIQENLAKHGYQKIQYNGHHWGGEFDDSSECFLQYELCDKNTQNRIKSYASNLKLINRMADKYGIDKNSIQNFKDLTFPSDPYDFLTIDEENEQNYDLWLETEESRKKEQKDKPEKIKLNKNAFDNEIDSFINKL